MTGTARVSDGGAWPVVRLRGDIDLSNAEALQGVAEGAVPNTAKGLVLDLSGVTFLDSTGLRLLFRLARRLGDRQQSLRLVVPEGARIRRVLDFAGVATVAEVLPSYDPDPSEQLGERP
jgi:anti-anti-sigma factor